MATRILLRRGTAAEWATANPVLADGEIGWSENERILKIGDGVTPWSGLPSYLLPEVTGMVGTMVPPLVVSEMASNPTVSAAATSAATTAVAARVAAENLLRGGSAATDESGYVFAIADTEGKVALGITPTAEVVGKIVPFPGSIPLSSLGPDIAVGKPTTDESGYAYVVVDNNDKILFGVTFNNELVGVRVASSGASTVENSQYSILVDPRTDSPSSTQLFSHEKASGIKKALTTTGSASGPSLTSDGVVIYDYKAEGSSETIRRWSSPDGLSSGLVLPRTRRFSIFTDSMGSGWPDLLASKLGSWTWFNGGVGGQRAREIISRQGGLPGLVTVTGGSVPASGSVGVTVTRDPGRTDGSSTYSYVGTLAGIPGTLAFSGGVKTFTRTTAGSVTNVPANTPFYVTGALEERDVATIFWVGANDRPDAGSMGQTITTHLTAAEAWMNTRIKRFLILNLTPRTDEPNGSAARTNLDAANAALLAAFPGRYIDISGWLRTNGLASVGATPTAQDTTNVSNGLLPQQFYADEIHLSALGQQAVANRLDEEFTNRNWRS